VALTDYTSFNDIRAALGVSSEEIEDATLSLDLYEFGLISDLDEVDQGDLIQAEFAAVKLVEEGVRTAAQSKFFRAMTLFCTYSVARELTTSLPLFSPKEHTDGKAAFNRYADNPYKETIAAVRSGYERYKTRLIAAYAGLNPAVATVTSVIPLMTVSSPSSDPVTGV
jgi:hypothetical protein